MKKQHEIQQRIWKDKDIKFEGKIIYNYLYSKGYDKLLINLNVGELQQIVKISNQGLKKNLEKLETSQYLLYKEYDKGMYAITLLD